MRKLFIKLTSMFMVFNMTIPTVPVFAESISSERNVYSQKDYYGYELSWNAEEGYDWDLLQSVSVDGTLLSTYTYDLNYNRSSKMVDDKMTLFNYSEDNRLLSVRTEDSSIYYFYDYDYYNNEYIVSGFIYNGEQYWFSIENGIITGIDNADGEVARYDYSGNSEFIASYEYVDGEYILNDDEDFIGNINCVRFNTSYYDKETGWYYRGRYYDPLIGRYVDGISENEALQIIENDNLIDIGCILARVYSSGCYIYSNKEERRAINGKLVMSERDVVARVIYAEAGTEEDDWHAVAWVIYNRMQSPKYDQNTAYGIVTYGDEFSAYNNSDLYFNPDTTTSRWKASLKEAYVLCMGNAPGKKVSYIDSQLFFRSVPTFCDGYSIEGTESKFGGIKIKDIAIPAYASISEGTSVETVNGYATLRGRYNIYFNEK